MILILAREGQMCNQLVTLASAYALGLEYGNNVKCPVMDEKLKNYFMFKSVRPLNICVEMYESAGWLLLWNCIRVIKRIFKLKFWKQYNVCAEPNKIQVFFDWAAFSDGTAIKKHYEEIREYFRFKKYISDKCERLINEQKSETSTLVAVHIRRGDYRTFNGGKWFYSDDQYCVWMKQLAKEKNVKYIIFSNEYIDSEKYRNAGVNAVFFQNTDVEDLCCMSLCDYIMGPPSTYSSWAAMYGGKRRLELKIADASYTWNDFV